MKTIPVDALVAFVDDEDFDKLNAVAWHLQNKSGYAGRSVYNAELYRATGRASTTVYMHREIMQPPPGMDVDHINGNRLDNQRANLRIATRQQNHMNRTKSPGTSSRYKGVSWDRKRLKWQARIKINRKTIHLGRFDDEVDAALAYDTAANQLFGERAKPNFRTVPILETWYAILTPLLY